MADHGSVQQLVNDLDWPMSQLASRGIKNRAGQVNVPHNDKRGLESAIEKGDDAVVAGVRRYVESPPSDGFRCA